MRKKIIRRVFCLAAISFFIFNSSISFAVVAGAEVLKNALPGSTQPGVIGNIMSTPKPRFLGSAPAVKTEQQQENSLGPAATQIKFLLKKIILEDNQVYSDQELTQLFKDKLNKEITVAELQSIVQDITNFYRNNGYILSRAILPPQHVREGIVHVKIIEGYIDHVEVVGVPKGARKLIESYGEKIAANHPLQLKNMEYYLRLANEIPGAQVKAILEPSKTNVGASTLNLSAVEQTVNGSYSYDNYGTRYLGPNQNTVNVAVNSIFRPGDSTRATYVVTTRPHQLQFYDVSYRTPFGSHGLAGTLGKNHSTTQPGMNLALLDVNGDAATYYGLLEYPLIRARDKNLTLDGGFNYMDSEVNSFNFLLYNDHIRSLKAGGNFDFVDRLLGSNLLSLHAEQGFNVFGASNNPNSTSTSRFGATGIFTKGIAQAARIQPIYGRFSIYVLASGQYSFNPLLSGEQFSFGGSQLGRGYDPAEIIGDKGVAGTMEMRFDFAPGLPILNAMQAYAFYDIGVVWNLKDVIGINSKQSAASTGIGSRFQFSKNISGNLMFAQPLTKNITSLELIGRGRCPRVLFSLVASV